MTIHYVPVGCADNFLSTKLTPNGHAEARTSKRRCKTLARRLQDEVIGVGLGIIWIMLGMRKFCMDRRRDWD